MLPGCAALNRSLAVAALVWPLTLVALPGCAPARPGHRVTLSGAQIAVELVESWLADARPPRFLPVQVAPVYLSQHGFENLARGECDLACTDRRISEADLEKFGDRTVTGQRVAFYGYALYVHPDNPLDAIFGRHIRLLLQKRIRDWRELAGSDLPDWAGPITIYGLGKSTRAGMLLSQYANIFLAEPTWQVQKTDADVIAQVAADPYALGFASIGHDGAGVRYLWLRLERHGPAAWPSLEEIESERYGLAKLIYVYYVDPPSPQVIATLDYLFSDEGRRAIESTDLWAVPRERAAVTGPGGDEVVQ